MMRKPKSERAGPEPSREGGREKTEKVRGDLASKGARQFAGISNKTFNPIYQSPSQIRHKVVI